VASFHRCRAEVKRFAAAQNNVFTCLNDWRRRSAQSRKNGARASTIGRNPQDDPRPMHRCARQTRWGVGPHRLASNPPHPCGVDLIGVPPGRSDPIRIRSQGNDVARGAHHPAVWAPVDSFRVLGRFVVLRITPANEALIPDARESLDWFPNSREIPSRRRLGLGPASELLT